MPLEQLRHLELSGSIQIALERWLQGGRYAAEREAVLRLVEDAEKGREGARAELIDAFSGVLPIGTGGRRGRCGPGPNRVNAVLMRETVEGLFLALKEWGAKLRVAVVYDTRRSSREFAQICAAHLAERKVEVVLCDQPRPTPQLSFLVRELGCGAGIVISASHNPPEDNGIKIYGPDGAQVLGLRDRSLMSAIKGVIDSEKVFPELDLGSYEKGGAPSGVRVVDPTQSVDLQRTSRVHSGDLWTFDQAYQEIVCSQAVEKGSLEHAELSVVFSPLHGVGHYAIEPVLRSRGIRVSLVDRQCDSDGGRFSTVESANPEDPRSMEMAIEQASKIEADLVLASDPDADRLGACVRNRAGEYEFVDGNRLGVLMLDHVLSSLQSRNALPSDGWVISTLVTTPMLGRIAKSYGVEIVDDLLVGFKHHAGLIEEASGRPVIFASEESHGYLRGGDVRDKDSTIAALLISECAALERARGGSLLDRLERLWLKYGYHRERTVSLFARGAEGRKAIQRLMATWRQQPPTEIGGLPVVEFEDRLQERGTGSATRDLPGNVLVFELNDGSFGCRVVVRPSGTEPKAKLYVLANGPEEGQNASSLGSIRSAVDAKVEAISDELRRQAAEIMKS